MNSQNEVSAPEWRSRLAEYPIESHFVDVGGVQMHYIDEGEGDPVLMVHGNPTWSYYYRNLVTGLSSGNRCLAVDHIGCGLSEKPSDMKYSLDLRIKHLVQFVRELDLSNISLLVHDWGGAIGLGAALEDLDRYKKFVVFNTAAFPPPFFPLRIRVCRAPFVGKIALQQFNLFAKAAVSMATERRGGLDKHVAQGMLAPYDSWANRRAIYEFVTDIPTRPNQPTWQRLLAIEKGLGRLATHPVKLIWGMKDWCFRPECLRKFEEIIPHAKTREFAEGGHYIVEDGGDDLLAEVRSFLAAK